MSSFLGNVLNDRSGKFNRQDDFAGLSLEDNDVDTYDFEDTYDGLGDHLDEANDDYNDDTFGDTTVGKDFDFSGKTAKVADTMEDEQLAFQRRQPVTRAVEIDRAPVRPMNGASWNVRPQESTTTDPWSRRAPVAAPAVQASPVKAKPRKAQTLAEIEAEMLASRNAPARPVQQLQQPPAQQQYPMPQESFSPQPFPQQQLPQQAFPPQMRPPPGQMPVHYPPGYAQQQQMMQRGMMPQGPVPQQLPPGMLHVPHMSANQQMRPSPRQDPIIQSPQPGKPSVNFKEAMAQDAASLQAQQQKNLRRAQKIGAMARYNGIMSNGDKNYVLKVQISQLVSEDPEADDFYYTVHSTLRGRSNVQQSLGHYEQTYLHRAGQSNRRGNKERQNPMLKMQQQVQKIIASAKTRPKSTSLAVAGSLGKLSFSRVRQPKQAISVKMPESSAPLNRQSKKEALNSIEHIYSTMLGLEHTARQGPPHDAPTETVDAWKTKIDELSDKIWSALRIMDQVDHAQLHPFIQLLQYSKGKKLIPRLYRGLNFERRLTLMTMIVAHLDTLDVLRLARYDESGNLPREIKEEIELFTQTVLPPLLAFTSEAPMKIVVGLLGMLLERNDIYMLCMSRVGLSFLTMFVSRAEIAKQAEQLSDNDSASWQNMYNRMFSKIEGKFGLIFPPASLYTDEIYPWQFLAACAVSASPEQQHILVNEARDRVLENVTSSKKLPKEMADIKRGNVNLFLNAIGLDASQLEA